MDTDDKSKKEVQAQENFAIKKTEQAKFTCSQPEIQGVGNSGHGSTSKGLTLQDADNAWIDYSSRASNNTRVLCFAGFTLVWIFGNQQIRGLTCDLLVVVLFLVITLMLDLAQYVVGEHKWGTIVCIESERGTKRSDEIHYDTEVFKYIRFFYRLKLAVLVVSYIVMVYAIISRMGGTQSTLDRSL